VKQTLQSERHARLLLAGGRKVTENVPHAWLLYIKLQSIREPPHHTNPSWPWEGKNEVAENSA